MVQDCLRFKLENAKFKKEEIKTKTKSAGKGTYICSISEAQQTAHYIYDDDDDYYY